MSHSQHVHAKHYEKLRGAKRAATAHMLRQQLITKTSSDEESSEKECVEKSTPKTQKQTRMFYTAKEEDLIKSWFKTENKNSTTASLSDCRKFLKRHPMKRTDKKIQDKVAVDQEVNEGKNCSCFILDNNLHVTRGSRTLNSIRAKRQRYQKKKKSQVKKAWEL